MVDAGLTRMLLEMKQLGVAVILTVLQHVPAAQIIYISAHLSMVRFQTDPKIIVTHGNLKIEW